MADTQRVPARRSPLHLDTDLLCAMPGWGPFDAQTESNGVATISLGPGAYSDDTDIFFLVSKTCGTNVTEAVSYSAALRTAQHSHYRAQVRGR